MCYASRAVPPRGLWPTGRVLTSLSGRSYHSAREPSAWRSTGLRHRWPASAASRRAASSISMPSSGPVGRAMWLSMKSKTLVSLRVAAGRSLPALSWMPRLSFLDEGVRCGEVGLEGSGEGDRSERAVRGEGDAVCLGHRRDAADLRDAARRVGEIGLGDGDA